LPRTSGPDLKLYRQSRRITQRLVADLMGVSRERVGQIERAAHVTPATVKRYLAAVQRAEQSAP